MVSVRLFLKTALAAARRGPTASNLRSVMRPFTETLCILAASMSWCVQAQAQQTQPAQQSQPAPQVAQQSQAAAQAATPGSDQNGSQPKDLQEVTVTGSRIKRTTDFNTPTPTTVIDSATMQNLGIVNVGQALTMTPANVSTFTPANTGNSNFFTGEYIADLRGLNPYFGSRTLVLLDGERTVNSNQGDSFDLNLVPQILVSRIDTVTGGASAAYGSGAIAGVENIIFDDKLEGGKLEADGFETDHSDARDRHVGAAFGHSFLDNRFHFLIGGEYEHQDALGCEDVRSWCAQNQGTYQLGTTAPASGSLAVLGFGSNLRSNFNSTTGVLYPLSAFGGYQGGPGAPVSLTPDGMATQPYQLGSPQNGFNDVVQGGQGTPIYQYTNLQAPVVRATGMAQLTGEITNYLNFKTSFLIAHEVTTDFDGGGQGIADYISPNNAYACPGTPNGAAAGSTCVNPGSPSLAGTLGTAGAYLNKDWTDQTDAQTRFTTEVQRFTFGLNGKFWDSSWSWDANYEYGTTTHDQLVQDNLSLYRVLMALDTVNTPSGPQCRVTADGFAAAVAANPAGGYGSANPLLAQGCVPLNPFGNQPLSQAASAYAFSNLLEQLRNSQTDFTLNASGDYFKGVGAGPFTLALGYEWRQEVGNNIDQPGQPAYLADDYATQYGSSFGGIVTVNEEYLEANFPVFKDKPFAHLLEFDLAARESQYDNQALYGINVCSTPGVDNCPTNNAAPGEQFNHTLTTWKASGLYEPVEGVRFRASQSRDERAPNFRELYYNQVIGAGGIFGQCGPEGTVVDPCTWNLLGNPNLKPEQSDTTTLGFVLTPTFLPGFQFSADWWHITVSNAIEQADPALIESNCRLNGQCQGVTFNNTPVTAGGAACGGELQGQAAYMSGCYNLSEIQPTSYNGAFYEVKGVDFSLNDLVSIGQFGTINTRLLTTWTGQQEFQEFPGGPVFNILGQTGTGNNFLNDYTPAARWRGSLSITWSQGPISITPNMNFVGHGTLDYLGVTPSQGALYTETVNGTLPPALAAYGFHPLPYNYVPSYFLFGLNGTYSFADEKYHGLQVFVQVTNLFNKTPPFAGGGETEFGVANSYGGTNPIFFDTLGLGYRVGFRMKF
jgi:iron complex outermembrane recepter protein